MPGLCEDSRRVGWLVGWFASLKQKMRGNYKKARAGSSSSSPRLYISFDIR